MKNKTVIAILIVVFIKKLIVLITTILLFVGTFTFNTVYDNYDNREGKILNSSDGIFELLDEVPALQIDAINITGCKWYEQIALKDGNSFTFFTPMFLK